RPRHRRRLELRPLRQGPGSVRRSGLPMRAAIILIMAAALLGACGDDESGPKSLDDLSAGACGAPSEDSTFIHAFTTGSCQGDHAMEVAGRYDLDAAEYPGTSRLRLETQKGCLPI